MGSRSKYILGGLTVAIAVSACQGPVAPLSVQAGGSITIPIGTLAVADLGLIGYGGIFGDDPQRGRLVFRLDAPDGFPLSTRLTASIQPSQSTSLARTGVNGTFIKLAPVQIVSLVDIPTDAPPGTHGLFVTRERLVAGQLEVDQIPYAGTIRILPHEITVELPGGGSENITGEPTPIDAALFLGGDFVPVTGSGSPFGPMIVPKPELVLTLNRSVHSADLVITYPSSTIDVLDVYEPIAVGDRSNHRALVWYDDADGLLHVSAVNGGAPFRRLAVAFDLDDPSAAILDPADVAVTVNAAADADGVPFAGLTITRSIR